LLNTSKKARLAVSLINGTTGLRIRNYSGCQDKQR
jgi:hypothetical protein